MTIETARELLGWCTAINVGFLIWWLLFFWLAHDWMYRFHSNLAKMSVETFDGIHYAGIAAYKVGILLLNFVPYLALHIVG